MLYILSVCLHTLIYILVITNISLARARARALSLSLFLSLSLSFFMYICALTTHIDFIHNLVNARLHPLCRQPRTPLFLPGVSRLLRVVKIPKGAQQLRLARLCVWVNLEGDVSLRFSYYTGIHYYYTLLPRANAHGSTDSVRASGRARRRRCVCVFRQHSLGGEAFPCAVGCSLLVCYQRHLASLCVCVCCQRRLYQHHLAVYLAVEQHPTLKKKEQ